MKLLIVGIDGATFDLVRPWADEGYLPNLARLMAGGVQADLASTLPPVTSPAWPTFMTGCNPGKHGVFDFIQPAGSGFNLVNSTQIKQPTIWQRLSASGHRVGVLNVPVTYPPQKVNGFMITGILSPHGSQICYPDDLIERYRKELGDYRVAPNVQYKQGIEAALIDDLYDLIRCHGDWALRLMEDEAPDVLMVHFIALDIMMHALWRFMDRTHPRFEAGPYEHAIRDGYRLVDDNIGRLLARLPEEANVLVMSDHGFGPLHKIVNLNVYLMQLGLLKLAGDPWTQLKASAFSRGLTPAGIYRWLERLGLQSMATRVSKATRNQVVGKFLSFANVDWTNTVAYSMGHVGQVYLNLAGREPWGIVQPDEYWQTRQAVINALLDLKDAEGRRLVTDVIVREESYHGPYAELGPDIHLVLDDYRMIAFPLFATEGRVIADQIRGDSGCHRRHGIFIAHGPAIGAGQAVNEANIADLAATIMYMLGEPVPRIMDGRVLEELFTEPGQIRYSDEGDEMAEAEPARALDDAESAQVEERLRSLGYL
jgi:predicted AlkP superfamily phosphohydrolase/phosphomutase